MRSGGGICSLGYRGNGAGNGGCIGYHSCENYKPKHTVLSFLRKYTLLGGKIFIVLKIKYLNTASEGADVT